MLSLYHKYLKMKHELVENLRQGKGVQYESVFSNKALEALQTQGRDSKG